MRWRMPSPKFVLKSRSGDSSVTNVRNLKSPHWQRWLGPKHRCRVPSTSILRIRDDRRGQEGPGVVRRGREPIADGLRRNLDKLDQRSESEGGRGQCGPLRLPRLPTQRRRRPDPSEGDAGHPD